MKRFRGNDLNWKVFTSFFRSGIWVNLYSGFDKKPSLIYNVYQMPNVYQDEMVEMLGTQVVSVYKELLNQAANSPLFFIDDSGAKILSLLEHKEQLKEAGERTGIFATGIVARKEEHHVAALELSQHPKKCEFHRSKIS